MAVCYQCLVRADFKDEFKTPGCFNPRPSKGWLGDASAFSFGSSRRHEIGIGVPGQKPTHRGAPGYGIVFFLKKRIWAQF